jgi:hypothetical protein
MALKGVRTAVAALPAFAFPGDAYLVTATTPPHVYVWSGTAWVDGGTLQGPQGSPGVQGVPGTPGVSGYQVVTGTAVTVPVYDLVGHKPGVVSVTVPCPAGKVAVGGGASFSSESALVQIVASYPVDSGHGWKIVAQNLMPTTQTMTPYVVAVATS